LHSSSAVAAFQFETAIISAGPVDRGFEIAPVRGFDTPAPRTARAQQLSWVRWGTLRFNPADRAAGDSFG